jgi:carboxylesterase
MSEPGTSGQTNQPAALLVHGFNGEPLDMHELGETLRARDFATHLLLLPGHGTHFRHFARTTWADWSAAVASAARELLERHAHVILIGHSMGAALALHTAANEPRVAGVVALCPPLNMHFAQKEIAALTHRVMPYWPTFPEDVRDPAAPRRYNRQAYRWTSVAAAHSLFSTLPTVRDELPRVRCPAFIACALHDHVVPARDGMEVFRRLGTLDKEMLVLERSYHGVTKDVEREQLFARVGAFATRVTAPQPLAARLA